MGQPAASSEPYFDQAKVDEVVEFIECLTLTKCTKSLEPEPFEILPHTRRIITGIYGWRRPDGRRLVRKCFATFGRKQAKTQIAAAICAYEFFMGEEPMQEIYFAATAADQAAKCYEAIRDMIAADPELSALCKITESIRRIVNTANGNIMQVLSADGKKQHGSNPSVVVFDELHAWTAMNLESHTALSTGSKSRRQPLWLMPTTAGSDMESLWGQEYEYAKKVESGEIIDPTYLPIIYEVPADADWTDKSLWHLALPLLLTGHQRIEDYDEDFQAALQRPAKQNEFRNFYLNQCTSSETQWIPIKAWDDCQQEIEEDVFAGCPCWGGLDLGSTNDFTSFALAFKVAPERIVLRVWAYVPAATLAERAKRDGRNYQYWVDRGWLRTTKGQTTDWDEVFDHILELRDKYKDFQAIAFDRWRIKYIEKRAQEEGIQLIEWGQGFRDMAPAIDLFEGLVYNKNIAHDGNLAMRWNMDCSQVKSDPAGNKKLVKPPAYQKSKHIDMAVASVMAAGASMLIDGDVDPYSRGASLRVV